MATLTSKGQITVPKRVRDALAVQPGDKLAFRIHDDGSVTVEAETVDLGTLRGAIKAKVRGVTVDDMKETVRRSALRQ
jgi:AbrB family looped-hinge helix DNA binding protein